MSRNPHLLVLLACLGWALPSRALDLSNAVVVCAPNASPRQKQAVKMLVEEAEKRTRIHWPQLTAWPTTNVPVIAVGLKSALRELAGPHAEGLQSAPAASAAACRARSGWPACRATATPAATRRACRSAAPSPWQSDPRSRRLAAAARTRRRLARRPRSIPRRSRRARHRRSRQSAQRVPRARVPRSSDSHDQSGWHSAQQAVGPTA